MNTDAAHVLRLGILGFSGLATGFSLFLAWHSGVETVRTRRVDSFWELCLFGGLSGIIVLVAQAVYGADGVEPTWQAFGYGASLTALVVGLFGVGFNRSKYGRRKEDRA